MMRKKREDAERRQKEMAQATSLQTAENMAMKQRYN